MSKTTSEVDDSIPWAVILSVLTLSLISAWLVFMRDWNFEEAMLTVSATAFGFLALLVGVIWFLADAEGRDEFWQGFKHTFRDDRDRILRHFKVRRRK